MELWQREIVSGFTVYALTCFVVGIYQSRKHNYCGVSYVFYPLGAYVWADCVIFGLFFTISSLVIYYLKSWALFWAFYFVFQAIRTFGESVYWFNQQFSTVNRNPGKTQWPHFFFKDEYTIWFVYQIMWQAACAVSTILAIYFVHQWLNSL